MTAAWAWIKAQLLDLLIFAAVVLAFVAVVKGGAVAGLIAASLAIFGWLSASILEQIRVVENPGRVTPERSWEKDWTLGARGAEGSAEPNIAGVHPRWIFRRGHPAESRKAGACIKPGRVPSVESFLPSDSRASASGPASTGSMATSPPGGVAGPFNPRASLSAKAADARLSVAEDGTGREQ